MVYASCPGKKLDACLDFDDLAKSVDDRVQTGVISLDFSKAVLLLLESICYWSIVHKRFFKQQCMVFTRLPFVYVLMCFILQATYQLISLVVAAMETMLKMSGS